MTRPNPDQIEDAATWLLRLRDRSTPRVRDEFERWMAIDPAHEVAFQRAELIFGALDAPAALVVARDAQARDVVRARRVRRWAAIAAGVLIALGVGLVQLDVVTTVRADVVTVAGESRTVTLPDGSTVTLNTDTALRYDGATRHVHLDRGEAFFEVAKDPDRPFVVDSGGAQVRVIGTQFNVRRIGDGVAVDVLEGRVQLRSRPGTDRGQTMDADEGLVLAAGHAALLAGGHVTESASPDVGAALAWRDGRAIFYGATLADVVGELARYRRGSVLIVNPRIRARKLSGVFNIHKPDAALQIAAKTVDVKIARLPGGALMLY